MIARLTCCLLLLLLCGCGKSSILDYIPFLDGEEKTAQPAEQKKAPEAPSTISPEAQVLLEQARACWTPSGECIDPEKAVILLDKAVELDPLDPEPLRLRSLALSEMGYMEEAFNDATRAIRMAPTAKAYATRGLVCLKIRQPSGAERDFAYAEKLDPNEALLYVFRAAAAFLEERKSDACSDLEKACTLGLCAPWDNAKQEKLCR